MYRVGPRGVPANVHITGASDWFLLHRSFAEYAASNDTFVLELRRFYDFSLLAAESFFHTLALNSECVGDVGMALVLFLSSFFSAAVLHQ